MEVEESKETLIVSHYNCCRLTCPVVGVRDLPDLADIGSHVTREGGFRTEPCCLGYGSAAPLGTASALAPRWASLDELQPVARENVAKRGGSR